MSATSVAWDQPGLLSLPSDLSVSPVALMGEIHPQNGGYEEHTIADRVPAVEHTGFTAEHSMTEMGGDSGGMEEDPIGVHGCHLKSSQVTPEGSAPPCGVSKGPVGNAATLDEDEHFTAVDRLLQ